MPQTPLSVSALDGQPIGDGKVTSATTPLCLCVENHNENIFLHLLDSPQFPVVLGFPWLNRHNLLISIDWSTGDAHNTLQSSSTGLSPFQCQFGFQPPLFPEQEGKVGVPSALYFLRRCRQTWKMVCQALPALPTLPTDSNCPGP